MKDRKRKLINRTILPFIAQNNITAQGSTQTGLGDIVQSLFFSPALPTKGGLIWSVGLAFLLPIPTSDSLGSGKWGAGPRIFFGNASVRPRWGFRVNLSFLFPKK